MRRTLMLVLVVALAALVFAPAAFAQDDNPTVDDLRADDRGGERGFDDNPSRDDLGANDNGGSRGFDDNPTRDDLVASPSPSATSTSSATPTASATSTSSATPDVGASSTTDAGVLPETGGVPLLSAAAGLLLVGSGIATVMLMGRTS